MNRNIFFGVIIGLLIITISSCSLLGTSMADRASQFIADLNGTRSGIMENIHPDAPGYATANGSTYFDNGVWATKPFSISNIVETSDTLSASFSYGAAPTSTIVLKMKDAGDFFSGENWKIWSCTVGGGSQF
jgi:hypothetical protein